MDEFDREIRSIANDLTELFKKVILRKRLYRTGALYRSVKFKPKVYKNGSVDFIMSVVDYFKYLDEPYQVSATVYATPEYKRIQERIVNSYRLWLMREFNKAINKNKK
jgi:hypothetical protein